MTTKKIILYFFFAVLFLNSIQAQEGTFPSLKLEAGDTNFYQIRAKLHQMLDESQKNGIDIKGEDGIAANVARWERFWSPRVNADGDFNAINQTFRQGMINTSGASVVFKDCDSPNDDKIDLEILKKNSLSVLIDNGFFYFSKKSLTFD